MSEVTIRDLRNKSGEVIDRAPAGERMTVNRDGTPVADLRLLRRRGPDAATLLLQWRALPPVDADRLRRDIDDVIDPTL